MSDNVGDDDSYRDRRPDQHNRRRSDNKFSVSAAFNITHIIATIGLIVSMFSWATEVKTIIATNTAEIANLKAERIRETAELRTTVREIDAKVTRLLERRTGEGP
jgi:uncharacterized protein YlxW (UPF0749 family)